MIDNGLFNDQFHLPLPQRGIQTFVQRRHIVKSGINIPTNA